MSDPGIAEKHFSPSMLEAMDRVNERYAKWRGAPRQKIHTITFSVEGEEGGYEVGILFDKNPLPDLFSYESSPEIFPGVYMLLGDGGYPCGVYLCFDVSEYMSLRLKNEYNRAYERFVRNWNKYTQTMPVEVLWEYVTEFFVLEQTEEMKKLYGMVNEYLQKHLVKAEVHFPLYEEAPKFH